MTLEQGKPQAALEFIAQVSPLVSFQLRQWLPESCVAKFEAWRKGQSAQQEPHSASDDR